MNRYLTYADIANGKCYEHGESRTIGSSLTIPGQGCDLAQIISSIVKLPPLDERTFDSPAGEDPDLVSLGIKTDLDSLYLAEGKNLAEDAKSRQNARKAVKKENDDTKEAERSENDDTKE